MSFWRSLRKNRIHFELKITKSWKFFLSATNWSSRDYFRTSAEISQNFWFFCDFFLFMCVVLNFLWGLTEVFIIFRVDKISSSRVQGAQVYRTAQRYLTLNSREKRVKKNAHMRAIFSNARKKRARKKLIGMSKAVFCLTLNWFVIFSWILSVNLKVRLSETIFLLSEILSDSLSSKLNLTPLTVNTAP